MILNLLAITVASGLAVILLHWFYHVIRFKFFSKLPPGPIPLPIIGNANWFFSNDAIGTFKKLREQYGDLVTIHIGHSTEFIFVLGYKEVATLFGSKDFAELTADRPGGFSENRELTKGILWARWPQVLERRKFVTRWLKEFGLTISGNTKAQTTDRLEDEAVSLVQYIDERIGQPMSLSRKIIEYSSNCVLVPLRGRPLDFNDAQTKEIFRAGDVFFNAPFLSVLLAPFASYMKHVAPDTQKIAEETLERILTNWLADEIGARRAAYKRGERQVNDFIDAFVQYENETSSERPMTEDGFYRVMVDVFLAAMETTGQTINWIIFYLAHHPEWQEKIYGELSQIVPGNSLPKLHHRSQIVLLEAFCQEVIRHSSYIMYTFFKNALNDFKYGKYEFKQGTAFLLTVHPSHFDDEYWGDSKTFRPERWLTEDNQLKSHTHFIPFGIGKRNCPGEIAARAVTFLSLSSMVQRFKWKLAKFVPMTESRTTFNRNPPEFELIFSERDLE